MMRREEFIVVMRRIWLENPIFEKKYTQNPREENELFVDFGKDVVGDMADDFEIEEAIVYLREKRRALRLKKKKDLVWKVIFDSILEDIISAMQTIAAMPTDKRPVVVDTEVREGYCTICGEKLFDKNYRRNPEPIFSDEMMDAGAVCCDECDRKYVTPVRAIVWDDEGGGIAGGKLNGIFRKITDSLGV